MKSVRKRSYLFIIDVLACGGAQRVLLHHADFLVRSGRTVTIAALKKPVDFSLPDKVRVVTLLEGHQRITDNLFPLLSALNELAGGHDAVIGFMDYIANYLSVLVAKMNGKPVCVSSRNTMSSIVNARAHAEVNHRLTALTYNCADLVVCPSSSVREDLALNFAVDKKKTVVLENPVDIAAIQRLMKEPIESGLRKRLDGEFILSVGRLNEQKNFPALIRSFDRLLRSKGFDLKLAIIGEGEQREDLERLIAAKKLGNRVLLLGKQSNPYSCLHRARFFILPSLYEGLPNVLLEAMAAGIPVAASDIGPVREIIVNGETGVLFDPGDEEEITETMSALLDDRDTADSLAKKASQRISLYDKEKVGAEFMRILDAL